MKRAVILCLLIVVLTMPSIVNAESNIDPQQDTSQQDKYKRDKLLLDKQQQDQQEQDKYKRDKQLRDKQQRDQQEQDRFKRDKQVRDKQQRDQQEQDRFKRDKQLRDKQQRDQQEQDRFKRDKQDRYKRDKQLRDKQQRDQHERDKQHRDNWQQNHRQQDGHHNWSHPTYHHKNWQRTDHRSYGAMPFNWHQKFDRYSSDYQMEPIHVREWNDRFPGLHPFRWMDRRGEGFWYRNQRILDAIMFYNDSEELVSIGFIHDGLFIMLRDDDQCYENHDSFFLSWWNRNGAIKIRL
ncbi:MAG: hypothetical protein H6Q68_2017 [Firmicutes bacterium]|nr:hypothetical protein [Bacillota bacterium]